MKNAVAIRHVAFENLGSWESLISKHYKLRYIDAVDEKLSLLSNNEIDLLIILGGPIGVYQEKEYPFIVKEIDLITRRLQDDLPTLGICLGSQLMAKALGSRVYPNHTNEIGWIPLELTVNGSNSCVKHLSSDQTSMFHWHGDTFDLPKGAKLLASTKSCQNQIFRWKNNGLAFQCHPEVNSRALEHWWIGHAAELSLHNLSINKLRDESFKLSPQLEKQAQKCVEEWIKNLTEAI